MSGYVIDIEADGPIPGDYSMIEIGAVKLTENLDETFYIQIRPISKKFIQSALDVTGYTREETKHFKLEATSAMIQFNKWIKATNTKGTRPMFFSDNNGFDWMFTHWYFIHFLGEDPFGHSSTNIGSLFKGIKKNMKKSFKKLRITKHTHNPVADAKGNAEALIKMASEFDLKVLGIE